MWSPHPALCLCQCVRVCAPWAQLRFTLVHTITTSDARYASLPPPSSPLLATVVDNDVAGLVVTPATLAITEDAVSPGDRWATYHLSLGSQPAAVVAVSLQVLTPSTQGRVLLSPTTLWFSPTNFTVTMPVNVSAVSDHVDQPSVEVGCALFASWLRVAVSPLTGPRVVAPPSLCPVCGRRSRLHLHGFCVRVLDKPAGGKRVCYGRRRLCGRSWFTRLRVDTCKGPLLGWGGGVCVGCVHAVPALPSLAWLSGIVLSRLQPTSPYWLSIPSGFLVVFEKPNRSSFTFTFTLSGACIPA